MRRAAYGPVLLALLLLAASSAAAVVPRTMSYQGVLTDASGVPVPDGAYTLAFALYAIPGGGAPLWAETHVGLAVSGGGFSTILGSITPLDLAFDATYYLGTSLNNGPEMTPRVALTSSPYALSLRLPFAGTTASPGAALAITNTNPLGPDLLLDHDIHFGPTSAAALEGVTARVHGSIYDVMGIYADTALGGQLALAENGGEGSVRLQTIRRTTPAGGAGELWLTGKDGFHFLYASSNWGDLGDPFVFVQGTNASILIDTGRTGDAAVALPANSIGPSEISGCPGLSQNVNGATVPVPIGVGPAEVISTTLTTTAPGYITVDVAGQAVLTGSAGNSWISYQIDEGSGGFDSQARSVGFYAAPNSLPVNLGLSAIRTYLKPAGTYTFHLRAAGSSGLSAAAIWSPLIRAMFLPVSYGAVTTLISSAEASATPGATPVPGARGPDGATIAGYQADLRELELREQRAQAQADRARLELLVARMRADAVPVRGKLPPFVPAIAAAPR